MSLILLPLRNRGMSVVSPQNLSVLVIIAEVTCMSLLSLGYKKQESLVFLGLMLLRLKQNCPSQDWILLTAFPIRYMS